MSDMPGPSNERSHLSFGDHSAGYEVAISSSESHIDKPHPHHGHLKRDNIHGLHLNTSDARAASISNKSANLKPEQGFASINRTPSTPLSPTQNPELYPALRLRRVSRSEANLPEGFFASALGFNRTPGNNRVDLAISDQVRDRNLNTISPESSKNMMATTSAGLSRAVAAGLSSSTAAATKSTSDLHKIGENAVSSFSSAAGGHQGSTAQQQQSQGSFLRNFVQRALFGAEEWKVNQFDIAVISPNSS